MAKKKNVNSSQFWRIFPRLGILPKVFYRDFTSLNRRFSDPFKFFAWGVWHLCPPLLRHFDYIIIVFKTKMNGKFKKRFLVAFVYRVNIGWRHCTCRRTIYELFWQQSFGSVLVHDILYYNDIIRVYKTDLSSKYYIDNDGALSLRVYEIICGLGYTI